ncbi:glycoside hydrolase family 79 protein [Abortiporus biennis]|nr:glycoside hydrolase family 79 protein [Abortiporus biennis]
MKLTQPPLLLVFTTVSAWLATAHPSVTVYGPFGAVLPTGASASSTNVPTPTAAYPSGYTPAAFNTVELTPPSPPNPPPPMQFAVLLPNDAVHMQNLSIPQSGSFMGFSIETSVVTQVIGRNSTFLQVPFLNLMSLMSQRGGNVRIRVGGNTQETAVIVDQLADGAMLEKDKSQSSNPTDTPTMYITPELFYMLSNVSHLVNTKWYLGIPFNDTSNLRLQIAEVAERILGDNVLGFQVGNEPDLYPSHGHRPVTYGPQDYFNEFGIVVNGLNNDANVPVRNNLIAPSVAGSWTPEMVWNTNFVPTYLNSLSALAVEHYPDNNCAAAFPDNPDFGPAKVPQDVFPSYLTHQSGISITAPFIPSTNLAQQVGRPFLMFETNTASCGGFPGVSDSFGSALWGLDYGLQMAYSNFSGALLHVGGNDASYNPFTPPPTNQSLYNQWTIGPIYYSALVMAEALGSSNQSQVVDLQMNSNNPYTPGYAIYENGKLARLTFINYINDPSGANTYTATISVGGQQFGENNSTPQTLMVKYLLAPSVASKRNITWAEQTLGNMFQADGRLQGTEGIQTVTCDQSANTCSVNVPAPGAALIFLNNDVLQESSPAPTATFSTSTLTQVRNTATVDPSILATSNGESGADRHNPGSTSKGRIRSGDVPSFIAPALSVLLGVSSGAFVLCTSLSKY